LLPYTTLFRSGGEDEAQAVEVAAREGQDERGRTADGRRLVGFLLAQGGHLRGQVQTVVGIRGLGVTLAATRPPGRGRAPQGNAERNQERAHQEGIGQLVRRGQARVPVVVQAREAAQKPFALL